MKDSGVQWIGDIPNNWVLGKTKNRFFNVKEIAGKKADNIQRLALTLNGVIKRSKEENSGLQPEQFETYQILRENELVFKLIDLENVSTSRVGRNPFDIGLVSPAYIVLRSRQGYSTKFAEYWFLSMWMNEVFNHLGGDGVRSSLGAKDLLQIPFPIISVEEQEAIANYLDEKCEKIDVAIEEAKKSAEEYDSLKKAIITNYIVGRDYDNRIETGNKWFPTIPKGWKLFKTLRVLEMPITDGPHTTPELYSEGIPFVSAEAVSCGNGSIDFNHIRGYVSQDFYEECCKKYIPKLDDVYMIKSGATTGKVSIVDTDKTFTIWSPLAVFRCNKSLMLPKYLFYMLQSEPYQLQVEFNWSFGTQQNIGMRTLEKLLLCVPPLKEQENILKKLERIIPKLNNLISEKEALLEDLEAYKKSLIYECVTGKREVIKP